MTVLPHTSQTVRDCLEQAAAALSRKDLSSAETWLRSAIGSDPTAAAAWLALGKLQRKTGRGADAIESLTRAAALHPSVDVFLLLGDLTATHGLNRQAAEHYRAAHVLAPDDINILKAFCYACAPYDLDTVVATLTQFLSRPDLAFVNQVMGLWLLVPFKEARDRLAHGLARTTASGPDDLGFQFTRDEIRRWRELSAEWVRLKPDSYVGLLMLAQSTFAEQSAVAAEPYFAKLRAFAKGELTDVIHFDPAFFKDIDAGAAATIAEILPPTISVGMAPTDMARAIFVGCDYAYAEKYGWPLLVSFAQNHASDVMLALHLCDATEAEATAWLRRAERIPNLRLSVSREWTGLRDSNAGQSTSQQARGYYHVARFVRFFEFLERHPGTAAWILDADILINRPIVALFDLLNGHDASVWFMPGRVEIGNQIAAGMVGIAPTPAGRTYLRRVAGYIAACLREKRLPWGTDQVALYAVYAEMAARGAKPEVAAVPSFIYNGTFGDDVTLWPGRCDKENPDYRAFTAALHRFRLD